MVRGSSEIISDYLSLSGVVEAKARERKTIGISLTAPIGRGRTSAGSDRFRYDTRKEGAAPGLRYPHTEYFGTFGMDRLDSDISGIPLVLEKRKSPVAVAGQFCPRRAAQPPRDVRRRRCGERTQTAERTTLASGGERCAMR